MTKEEKLKACLVELLAALAEICKDTDIHSAQGIAGAAIITAKAILKEGRIPDTQETIAWMTRRFEKGKE